MCGIAGLVRWDGSTSLADRQRVRAMAGALHHRGPDATNVLAVDDRTLLAHTRLAILDLSDAAAQPMQNADGRHALTYNGELYNHRSLRAELEREGVAFRSKGDTEVLLRALERWGDGALDRIDGMFAFASYDRANGTLSLGRDRSGKKPLFVAREQGALLFASELAALSAARIRLEVDDAHLAAFLTRGYVPGSATLARGIEQVQAGELWTITQGGRITRRRYWRHPWLSSTPPRFIEKDVDSAVRELKRLFTAAVVKRLDADVPVGAFLSGGVDSAAVVAVAQRATVDALKTCTIGFSSASGSDERAPAAETAALIGTNHEDEVAAPDVLDIISSLVNLTGEPQGDSSFVPTYLVSRLARRRVTVALSGDGGDELFAGYDRFLLALMAALAPRTPARVLARAFAHVEEGPMTQRWARSLRRWTRAAAEGPGATLMQWAGGTRVEDVAAMTGQTLSTEELAQPENEALAEAAAHGAPALHGILAANFVTYLPGNTLVKLDRASMASSLEGRSPFLDTDLIEYSARLAPLLLARGLSLKWVMKRALRDVVPTAVLTRRKVGFGAPVDDWLRRTKDVRLDDALARADSPLSAHVDMGQCRRLLAEHRDLRQDHGHLLTRLLTLNAWLDWTARARRAPSGAQDSMGAS
jgi:asparagine synthase (glutamine-hydrolysing)